MKKIVPGVRSPIVEASLLSSQRALSISTVRQDEIKWDKFREWVEHFLGKKIEPNPSQLLVRDVDLRLPVQFLGGGEQEVFALMWLLLDEGFSAEPIIDSFNQFYIKFIHSTM